MVESLMHSEYESQFFGLNVFRNTESALPEPKSLRTFALAHEADLIRLKIDVRHEDKMTHLLHASGFPFYFSHTVFTVIADYGNSVIRPYKNTGLSFEQYNGGPEHRARFFKLIYEGMFDDPIGYHKTPFLNRIIPKEKEARCYASYYADHYDGKQEGKIGFIMKKEGTDAGVFVFEIENKTIYTSMAAVLSPFRWKGIFHDMKVFRQHYCAEHGIEKAIAGYRSQNLNTPNSLLKLGYQIFKAEHVFHLPALLHYSLIEPVRTIAENIHDGGLSSLVPTGDPEIKKALHQKPRQSDIKHIVLHPEGAVHAAKISIPFADEDELLALVRFYDNKERLINMRYDHHFFH